MNASYRSNAQIDDAEDQAARESAALQALPIWARQIETARQQTEEAIVALSARFAGTTSRLDKMLNGGSRSSNPNDCRRTTDACEGRTSRPTSAPCR